jgi:hypothetical protein
MFTQLLLITLACGKLVECALEMHTQSLSKNEYESKRPKFITIILMCHKTVTKNVNENIKQFNSFKSYVKQFYETVLSQKVYKL